MKQKKHNIVVVGGGAGGLELATKLGNRLGKKQRATITLVDAQQTHFWKPLLHEVAAGALNAFEDELSYMAQAKWNHFRFIPGRMQSLQRDQKIIELSAITDDNGKEVVPIRTLSYDTLVIAVGSTANDFNTPGAKEHCLFLDDRIQAEHIHTTLINHYLHAQASGDESTHLDIAIIGAGATGVELAAELRNAAIELEKYGLDAIKPDNLKITIIEGGDRILPALPERISKSVHKQLGKLDINVMTGQLVSKIREDGLSTQSGRFITADLKIWAAGIKAPEFLKELDGLETNRINQLILRPTLQTTLDDNIYALGDCASCTLTDKAGKTLVIPPRAQAAHQQSSLLAKSLLRSIGSTNASGRKASGRKASESLPPLKFTYQDYGSLISLSRFSAIGNLMGALTGEMMVEGTLAKWFYISLYRMHQIALYGKMKTGRLMLKDLISKTTRPQLKLH